MSTFEVFASDPNTGKTILVATVKADGYDLIDNGVVFLEANFAGKRQFTNTYSFHNTSWSVQKAPVAQ